MNVDMFNKDCCHDFENLEEYQRQQEGSVLYVWYKCKTCNQIFLHREVIKKNKMEEYA